MEVLLRSENSGTIYQSTRPKIPEELNIHKTVAKHQIRKVLVSYWPASSTLGLTCTWLVCISYMEFLIKHSIV